MDSNRIHWEKKGLGWIPDLPDINRAEKGSELHNLEQETGNLRGDEASNHTTQLIELLIRFIETYETGLGEIAKLKDHFKSLKSGLYNLNNELSDDVNFREVKIFKPYKYCNQSQTSDPISKMIWLIKEYQEYQKISSFDQVGKYKFAHELLKKSLDNEFSVVTLEEIRDFQSDNDTLRDGIIGPETYNRIFEVYSRCKNAIIKDENIKYSQYEYEAILYYQISLDIDNGILHFCFDNLRHAWFLSTFKKAINSLVEESMLIEDRMIDDYSYNNSVNNKILKENKIKESKILERCCLDYWHQKSGEIIEFLTKFGSFIDLGEQSQISLSESEKDRQKGELAKQERELKGDIERTLFEFCEYIQREIFHNKSVKSLFELFQAKIGEIIEYENIKSSFISRSYEVFRSEFYNNFNTIEPLITIFHLVASPFSAYLSSDQAAEIGFDKLYSYFRSDFSELSANYEPFAKLSKLYSGQNPFKEYKGAKQERFVVKELASIALAKIKRKQEKGNSNFLSFISEIIEPFIYDGNGEAEKLKSSNLYEKTEIFTISDLKVSDNIKDDQASNSIRRKEYTIRSLTQGLTKPFRVPITVKNISEIKKKLEGESKKCYCLLPSAVDLSLACSPVRDQGSINSCTAISAIALVEYWSQLKFGKHTDLSPLFLYKVARDLIYRAGDTGASVQSTMQAMILFGIPPEECWPYREDRFNDEPPAFCYSYAQNYQALKYFRLDSALTYNYKELSSESEVERQLLLFKIKATLAAKIPCMFGLTLYSSVYDKQNIRRGYIPCPSTTDKIIGGHTLVAVGYNDYKKIEQVNDHKRLEQADENSSVQGAILVRNSWGSEWGLEGYGWLPYDYIFKGLTADWWSLVKAETFDRETLGLGIRKPQGDTRKPTGFPG